MTADQLPDIAKKTERLTIDIENAVRGFARYHKYTIGTDMRTAAMHVMKVCNRAWRERSRQHQLVSDLIWAVDELKLMLQLASQLRAFKSFKQFEAIIRLADMWRGNLVDENGNMKSGTAGQIAAAELIVECVSSYVESM